MPDKGWSDKYLFQMRTIQILSGSHKKNRATLTSILEFLDTRSQVYGMIYIGNNVRETGWSACSLAFLGIVAVGGLTGFGIWDSVFGPTLSGAQLP